MGHGMGADCTSSCKAKFSFTATQVAIGIV
eukprot:COSAG04_NODE_31151_length_258_cov_0.918239_1_plen_29_part_10